MSINKNSEEILFSDNEVTVSLCSGNLILQCPAETLPTDKAPLYDLIFSDSPENRNLMLQIAKKQADDLRLETTN